MSTNSSSRSPTRRKVEWPTPTMSLRAEQTAALDRLAVDVGAVVADPRSTISMRPSGVAWNSAWWRETWRSETTSSFSSARPMRMTRPARQLVEGRRVAVAVGLARGGARRDLLAPLPGPARTAAARAAVAVVRAAWRARPAGPRPGGGRGLLAGGHGGGRPGGGRLVRSGRGEAQPRAVGRVAEVDRGPGADCDSVDPLALHKGAVGAAEVLDDPAVRPLQRIVACRQETLASSIDTSPCGSRPRL